MSFLSFDFDFYVDLDFWSSRKLVQRILYADNYMNSYLNHYYIKCMSWYTPFPISLSRWPSKWPPRKTALVPPGRVQKWGWGRYVLLDAIRTNQHQSQNGHSKCTQYTTLIGLWTIFLNSLLDFTWFNILRSNNNDKAPTCYHGRQWRCGVCWQSILYPILQWRQPGDELF